MTTRTDLVLSDDLSKSEINYAMLWAARNGHLSIVKFFFDNGADVSDYNDCAITWAAEYGHLHVVEF